MRNRIVAYLLVALFVMTIWAHVIIAREHAATAQAYADATAALYAATSQNIRARMLLLDAQMNYRRALAAPCRLDQVLDPAKDLHVVYGRRTR